MRVAVIGPGSGEERGDEEMENWRGESGRRKSRYWARVRVAEGLSVRMSRMEVRVSRIWALKEE